MATTERATKIESISGERGTLMSMSDIRIVLSDQIRDLAAQSTSPANANAVTNAVGKLLSSLKLEMEYRRQMNRTGGIRLLEAEIEDEPDAP
jgi:hypothetical protein